MTATIEVPPTVGFWGPATPDGLVWSNWDHRKNWLTKKLSESQQRLSACAFSRRVLHIFEDIYPEDKRPRTSIETAERFAMGLTTGANLETASASAYAASAYASAYAYAVADAAYAASAYA